jgi:hypothetical protein
VPDSWWTVGELPRGGTGKVDRAAVAAAVVAGTLSPLTNRRPVAPGRRGPLP